MVGELPARAYDQPYFFLSYHRSEYRPDDGFDPDYWVKRFFSDLCRDVNQFAAASNPGFMDRQTPVGSPWRDRLAEAISCCKVFVPLLTPGYFTSEFCGREWTAFARRLQMDAAGGSAPTAIVPVLWHRLHAVDLPPQVSRLNLTPTGFPKAYEQQGLFVLMRLRSYSSSYTRSVLKIAQAINESGRAANLAAAEPVDLDSVPNAFAEHQARNTSHRVRIIVAAHPVGPGPGKTAAPVQAAGPRSSYYYGHKMREWNPYRSPTSVTPIARYAEDVIVGLNHLAFLAPLDEPAVPPAPMPSVVLLDPWAVEVPEIAGRLRDLDRQLPHVVVPWNLEDEQTISAVSRLERNIRELMPESLALNGSALQVTTLEAFRAALPKAVYEAISRHFRTAPAYPPDEPPSMDRLPRFGGPDK
jgi:FxsC-like protein